MKRKMMIMMAAVIAVGISLTLTQSCKKDKVPVLTTVAVTGITATSAISGGTITDDRGAAVIASGVCWSTSADPTVDNSKTQDGPAVSGFVSTLEGLSSNTTYYIRAYATNKEGTGYGNQLSFTTSGGATVTDYDGNIYHTVTIGTQTWLVENLLVIHYRNGDPIPGVTNASSWEDLSTGAYCDYDNTSGNREHYGVYYNWHAVNDSRNIAPVGWHVPTLTEMNTLVTYLGGTSVAGGKLKEIGLSHWNSPNTGATNETGFTAVGGGYRDYNGTFSSIKTYGELWTSTSMDAGNAYGMVLYYNTASFSVGQQNKKDGFNVRCIRD